MAQLISRKLSVKEERKLMTNKTDILLPKHSNKSRVSWTSSDIWRNIENLSQTLRFDRRGIIEKKRNIFVYLTKLYVIKLSDKVI